jgi:uncharacterized Tic20 family protein
VSETPNPLIPPPSAPPPPFSVGALTPDETTMAALAHLLQTMTWWIGPLIIFFVKRDSKFVSFHALQALLWQIIRILIYVICFASFFLFMFTVVVPHAGDHPNNQMPPRFFAGFIVSWFILYGGMMLTMVVDLTLSIVFGIKAGRGQWASYPLLGRVARRILGMSSQSQAVPGFEPPQPQG